MSALTIEAAALSDVDEVVALWRDCDLTRPWNDPVRDFQDAVLGETSTVLVARDDGRRGAVVGAIMAGFDGHRGWLYYLGVAPGLHGAGHGRALVVAAEAWLAAAGAVKVQLMVRRTNDAVVGFYERLGYEDQETVVLGRRFEPAPGGF